MGGVKRSPRASTTPCPLFASAGLSAPHWRHSTLSNKSSSEKLPRAPEYPTADLWEWLFQTVSFIHLPWVSFMTWKISPNNYTLPKCFQSHIQDTSTDLLYCTVLTYSPELQVHSQNRETSSGLGVFRFSAAVVLVDPSGCPRMDMEYLPRDVGCLPRDSP